MNGKPGDLRKEPEVVEEAAAVRPGRDYDRAEDVPGVMKVVRGRLANGTEYVGRCFLPFRTPEEQAARERAVRAACRAFIEDYAGAHGWEEARRRFEVGGMRG